MHAPPENFEILTNGLSSLWYFDQIQSIGRGSIKSMSGPADPLVDRAYHYFDTNENKADHAYLSYGSYSPLDYFPRKLTGIRIQARENIKEDIKLFHDTFPKLDMSNQYRLIELLRKRQEYLKGIGMDKYSGEYICAEKKYTSELTKNLITNMASVKRDVSTNHQEVKAFQLYANSLKEEIVANQSDIQQIRDGFAVFVAESTSHVSKVLQNIIQNQDGIQLNQTQISVMQERLNEIDYCHDAERAKHDHQYKTTQILLYKILEHEESKKQEALKKVGHEQAEGIVNAIETSGCAIHQLGALMDNKSIADAGRCIQVGTNLIKNLALVTGSFGFIQVGGLALLGPLSSIAIGTMALVGLFGKKLPSETQRLAQYISEFREMMERYLGRVLDNQRYISSQIKELHRFIANDLKMPINYKLDSILSTINKQGQEKWLYEFDNGLHSLHELTEQVDGLLKWSESTGNTAFESQQAFIYEKRLELWLDKGSRRPIFVGEGFNQDSLESTLVDIAQKLNYRSVYVLILNMALLAKRVDPHFPVMIELNDLINTKVFSMALTSYNRLISYKKTKSITQNPTIVKAEKSLKNFHAFLDYLANQPSLFSLIINIYNQKALQLDEILNAQVIRIKQCHATGKTENKSLFIKGSIASLISTDTENDVVLRHNLQIMDACRVLICAYCSLAGTNNEQFLNLMPASSQMLLNKQIDWSTHHNPKLPWPGHRLSYYKENYSDVRTIVATYSNKETPFLILLHNGTMAVRQFDADNNQWIDRPGFEYEKPYSYNKRRENHCFLVSVVHADSQDYIYVVYQSSRQIKLSRYDVCNGMWFHNLNTPKLVKGFVESESGIKTSRLLTQQHGQTIRLCFVMCDHKTVRMQVYDSQTDQWTSMLPGPAWPETPNLINRKHYLSFDAQSLSMLNNEEHIIVMMSNRAGLQIAHCDFNGAWHLGTIEKNTVPGNFNTISYTTVKSNDQSFLVAVIHYHAGIKLLAYSLQQNTWDSWFDAADQAGRLAPNWTRSRGYGDERYYSSLRVTTILLAGLPYLLCGMRNQNYFECFAFNPISRQWFAIHEKPAWTNQLLRISREHTADMFNNVAICLLPILVSSQHQQLIMLARTNKGLDYWQLEAKVQVSSSIILQQKISDYPSGQYSDSALLSQFGVMNAPKLELGSGMQSCIQQTVLK